MNKSHGLGSGIYGIAPGGSIPDQTIENYAVAEKIVLKNPVVIRSNKDDGAFTRLSVWLMLAVESKMDDRKKMFNDNDDINKIRLRLAPDTEKIRRLQGKDPLAFAVNSFLEVYHRKAKIGDFIKQPINFLLEAGGYDGVYNTSNNGNTFNRGCVKYTHHPRLSRHQKGALNGRVEEYFLEEGNDLWL